MADTYGEMFSTLIDNMAKFDERPDIFRRNEIPKGHFYNVINPNKTTSSGNAFYAPIEWLVRLTRDSKDFSMLKRIVKDCGAICITKDEVAELDNSDPEKALLVIQKVLGCIK